MRYDWKCKKCGHEVIVDRRMADYDKQPTNEECDNSTCEHEWYRVLKTTGFVLQGDGWFRDGYDGMGDSKMISK